MTFPGDVVASRWRVHKHLGDGSFGDVFSAVDAYGNTCAIKFEKYSEDETFNLRIEYQMLQEIYYYAKHVMLLSADKIPIIQPVYRSRHRDQRFMVTWPLGKSLETYERRNGGLFKYLAVYQTALQMIRALELTHKVGIAHMDIKVDNIIAGVGRLDNKLYLNDFGMGIRFLESEGRWYPEHKKSYSLGTRKFSSQKTMKGEICGPKQDLESLGYTLIYMLRGNLPWSGKDSTSVLLRMKDASRRYRICDGLTTIGLFFDSIDRLRWGEFPNYKYLRSLFVTKIHKLGGHVTGSFDWGEPKNSREGQVPGRFKAYKNTVRRQ